MNSSTTYFQLDLGKNEISSVFVSKHTYVNRFLTHLFHNACPSTAIDYLNLLSLQTLKFLEVHDSKIRISLAMTTIYPQQVLRHHQVRKS